MKKRLHKELLEQGASANEAENLARLAEQLSAAKPRGLSARAKQRMYDQLPINAPKERRPMLRWAMGGSLVGAMAMLALLILPGMLQSGNTAQPDKNDVRTLVQPIETELQELDMQVEQLQQQPTVDEVELQEAEEKYQRTFERFKNRYQNREEFKDYDWNKWRRNFQKRDNQTRDDNQSAQVNSASTDKNRQSRSQQDNQRH